MNSNSWMAVVAFVLVAVVMVVAVATMKREDD